MGALDATCLQAYKEVRAGRDQHTGCRQACTMHLVSTCTHTGTPALTLTGLGLASAEAVSAPAPVRAAVKAPKAPRRQTVLFPGLSELPCCTLQSSAYTSTHMHTRCLRAGICLHTCATPDIRIEHPSKQYICNDMLPVPVLTCLTKGAVSATLAARCFR